MLFLRGIWAVFRALASKKAICLSQEWCYLLSSSFRCIGGTRDELEKMQFSEAEEEFRWGGEGWRVAA